MTVQPGTRLGIYEVTAPLGAGGMGEVYRARDTKLNPEVAIKVLPEAFTTDPDRAACFQRPRADEVAGVLSRGFTLSGVLLQALKSSAAVQAAERPPTATAVRAGGRVIRSLYSNR